MGKSNKKSYAMKQSHKDQQIASGLTADSNAWVMTTKKEGDQVAGWEIARLYENNIRLLDKSERCDVTSFCYPSGARMVRAKLQKSSVAEMLSQQSA